MAEPSISTSKVCSKCGNEKPATDEHFRAYLNKGKHLIFRTQCRPCERETNGEINRRRNPAKVAEYLRASRAKNPERHKEYDRRNNERNKGAGSEYQKRRYARSDKEKTKAELDAWKKANPEKLRAMWERNYAKNKAKHHDRVMRWNAANPEKVAARRDRRRALKANAEGYYCASDVVRLLEAQHHRCFYCDGDISDRYHIDHFIPLSRGGSNWPHNLRASCASCNCSKSAKMPWEWMPDRFQPTQID